MSTRPEPSRRNDGHIKVESMVGRTIVAATYEDASPDHEWDEHEFVTVTLDDGRTIVFHGYGYDAWGIDVDVLA